jgi:hypothetical protein
LPAAIAARGLEDQAFRVRVIDALSRLRHGSSFPSTSR